MIVLTVGGQLPFDRLVAMADKAVGASGEGGFAQIGAGDVIPAHMDHARFLPKDAFFARARAARLLIGHAGIGTILTALEAGKPLLMMARQAALGEHRNDHQRATLVRFAEVPGIYPFAAASELAELLVRKDLVAPGAEPSPARARLCQFLAAELAAIDKPA